MGEKLEETVARLEAENRQMRMALAVIAGVSSAGFDGGAVGGEQSGAALIRQVQV